MNDFALLLALTLAVACGWWLGQWQARRSNANRSNNSLPSGINYLIDEVPDSAINAFLSALDVNSDTLETHLALASIHRRRGEVERAIRIHENLLNRGGISPVQRQYAQLELAQDYFRAGLLDRAEVLLQKLVESSDTYRDTALRRLLDIYQDEGEWSKAVHVCNLLAETLPPGRRHKMDRLRAHFYCELAEQARTSGDFLTARRALGRAEFYDGKNYRRLLEECTLELELENPERALVLLSRLAMQSRTYPEGMLPVVRRVFAVQSRNEDYHNWLAGLYQRFAVPEVLIELARQKASLYGEAQASRFLRAELTRNPSIAALSHLLQIAPESAGEVSPVLRRLLGVSSPVQAAFQCQSCGFEGRHWHWRCPRCKTWDSLVSNKLTFEEVS